MADFKEETTASECIYENLGTFANYTIATKFPNVIDGMKAVARRIIVTLHKMGPGIQKELSVGGEVVKMHPHGDSSINTAISVMAQPFTHIVPLVFSDSNIGNYDGDDPAGARYVDVAESDMARALFFQDTNPVMLKMVPCESEYGTEPAFMIPKLPTALMIPCRAIAVGYVSRTTMCSIPDLCKLTKEYIKLRNSSLDWEAKVRRTLVKYMLPDFPTYCRLRNSKELIEQYKKGNFNFAAVVDGKMSMTKDQIVIHTLPPDRAFRNITFGVGMTMAKSKNSFEAQHFQQMEDFAGDNRESKQSSFENDNVGIMEGCFTCVVRRGMNPFDALATLKKRVQFSSSWAPERNYTDSQGHLLSETPISLLDRWYSARYNEVLGDLKQTLSALVDHQRQLMALIIIRDHDEEVFHIFKRSKTKEDSVPLLVERFKLTKYQAKFVAGLTFAQITGKGKDDLLNELNSIKKKMEELNKKLHHIPDIMIEHVESFENKFVNKMHNQGGMYYDLSRRCSVPKYIGVAVYRDTGHIMIEDENEFDKILRDFDPEDIDIRLFESGIHPVAVGSEEDLRPHHDLPKYFKAGYVGSIDGCNYTACMCTKGGAMVVSGIVPKNDTMKHAVPIGKEFICIAKNGTIYRKKVYDKILRKSATSGATMRDVVHVSENMSDVIVIHGTSSQPNNLMIERVNLDNGPAKLRKICIGEWKILGIYPANSKRIYLNIPKELRQRCATRHIVIDNLGDYTVQGKRLNCTFGRNTIKSDFKFAPLRRKSTIVNATLIGK